MKRKFIQALNEQQPKKPNKYPLMKDFMAEWLAFKKPTIKETTYKGYVHVIDNDLTPAFGNKHIDTITRKDVQIYLNDLIEQGKNRTAQKAKQMLSAIFDIAVEDYNIKSPMTKIVLPHYEVEKGSPLTLDEERTLVNFCKANGHLTAVSSILVLLYTGMRIGELPSMKLGEVNGYKYIECETEKIRHGYAKVFRKIPVSPMLEKVMPYIDFEKAKRTSKKTISDTLKKVFPDRHVHELRYSFISTVKRCHCPLELVMLWDGHQFDRDVKSSKVDRGYTQYPDDFYFGEIKKVDYEL
jgi:integrase